jgi:hypothetical protein
MGHMIDGDRNSGLTGTEARFGLEIVSLGEYLIPPSVLFTVLLSQHGGQETELW